MTEDQSEDTLEIPKDGETPQALQPQPIDSEDRKEDQRTPKKSVSSQTSENNVEANQKEGESTTTIAREDSERGNGSCNSSVKGSIQRSANPSQSTPGAFAINNPLSEDPIVSQLQTQSNNNQDAGVTAQTSSRQENIGCVGIEAREIEVAVATPIDLEADDGHNFFDTNNKTKLPQHQRKVKQFFIGVGLMVLVALAVVLSIVLSRQNSNQETDDFPIAVDNDTALTKRREDMIAFLGHFDPDVFTASHLRASADRISALNWIVEDDAMQLPIPSQTEIESDDPSVAILRQRFGLALFYFATNGDQWEEKYNFLSEYDVCKWSSSFGLLHGEAFGGDQITVKGIICDQEGKVNRLRMWWNNLAGTLPDEFPFFLENLEELNLSGGSISGTIPSSIGNLSNMQELSVFEHCLTGTIPEEIIDLPLLSIFLVGGNNDQLSGDLEDFCDVDDPLQHREGVDTVVKDAATKCTCCLECFPDEFSCRNPLYNISWTNANIWEINSYDSNNNVKQFQKKCTTPAQLE
eukprot:CAMPEP_0116118554 /NCGR_PEP_ID=MMETSP0329-20121206/2165_1 /TAXON_ID=697910 /ORGANISM="Pseudo-nitzschia arenysensis, Strain B593" /LENGTH=521 /DNA_ID=CAMNT_0003612187 /DNA_START=20 /DNA_END=1585 /DNA_ORIENTATION=+